MTPDPSLPIPTDTPGGVLMPALLVSMALHAAVIAGLPTPWTFDADAARAPLRAHIEPAAGGAVQLVPPVPVAAPQPAPPVPQRATAVAAAPRAIMQSAEPSRTLLPAVTVAEPVAVPRAKIAAAASGATVAPATEITAAAEDAVAARPGSDALDPGSLAQYRLALIVAAKRQKVYPGDAIERGWQGRVDVRLSVGPAGELQRAAVQRSSGHEPLDRQALEMLQRASPLTPIPPSLRNREFSVDVPVIFALQPG